MQPRNKGVAARVGNWSATHKKKAIALWFAFVVLAVVGGGSVGQKELTDAQSEAGETRVAALAVEDKLNKDAAEESVLIQSKAQDSGSPAFAAAVADVGAKLEALPAVASVETPVASQDGHSELVTANLKGDPDDADDAADATFDAVAAAQKANPDVQIGVTGDGTAEKQLGESIDKDFAKAETLSLPITLLILVIAFGALVAAGVPVLLAISAVMATIGLVSIPSQLFPVDDAISSVILLIGMAVGVDYSLFYLRREREERAKGRSKTEAIGIAAATSGRAVLISGLTVIAAMAGMFLSGSDVFISFGMGTLLVVAVAMVGSLTFLPAMISLLGDKIEKGRVPFVGRRSKAAGESRIWGSIVRSVMRRPGLAVLAAGGVLLALTIPAFGMKTKVTGVEDLPQHFSTIQTYNKIQDTFPQESPPAEVVVQADNVRDPQIVAATRSLVDRANADGIATGQPDVRIAGDNSLAQVSLPLAGTGDNQVSKDALAKLRGELIPSAYEGTGAQVDVAGETASTVDWGDNLSSHLPLVFGFVLALAFGLMLFTFRSIVIPFTSIVLNLLSVGAAYGVLTLVFQHGVGEGIIGADSSAVTSWLPMFLFVILFGLSMDYHVFILSRIKELRDRGMRTEEAIEKGISTTAGTVTSAAVVMVAVFSIFGTLSFVDFKQMGVGLAAAILIDATVVRGVLLPATMKLLGERNWYLPAALAKLPVLRRREPLPEAA